MSPTFVNVQSQREKEKDEPVSDHEQICLILRSETLLARDQAAVLAPNARSQSLLSLRGPARVPAHCR